MTATSVRPRGLGARYTQWKKKHACAQKQRQLQTVLDVHAAALRHPHLC
jgi:hypothetical protein